MATLIGRREEEAQIRHRLGLALWKHGDLEGAQAQLERAAHILEAIRRESPRRRDALQTHPRAARLGAASNSMGSKSSLFDLLTATYQILQVRTKFVVCKRYCGGQKFCHLSYLGLDIIYSRYRTTLMTAACSGAFRNSLQSATTPPQVLPCSCR